MNFKQLDNGMSEGFCLIKKAERKLTTKGNTYLDLMLSDDSGEISAKLWDYNAAAHDKFKADMLVKVRGTLEVYNGKNQFRMAQMREVVPGDGVKIEDFVPSAPYSGQWIFDQLIAMIDQFQDEDLKRLMRAALERRKEQILPAPAALRLHHAMRGGLLYHTMSIAQLALGVCKVYPFVDRDLLLSGVILHDLAKTTELDINSNGLAKGYTASGQLVGHLVQGAIDISALAKELGIESDCVMLLEHMVISHHGEPEYGAAVRPMFLEAELLSELDTMDATVFEFANLMKNLEPGSFSDRQWALDNRKVYNHGRAAAKLQTLLPDETENT